MPKVKLHRCSYTFLHNDLDFCWRVPKALDEQGIEYEVVKHGFGKGKRPDVVALSGQKYLPVIEFEDGTAYREEKTDDMVKRVKAGELFGADTPAAP